MNRDIQEIVGDRGKQGDVYKYFQQYDDILEANSGVNDNKCLSINCFEPNTPIKNENYTKFKLTDSSVHITSIDKTSLHLTMVYKIKAFQDFWSQILKEEDTITNDGKEIGQKNEELYNSIVTARKYRNKFVKWFVGFKASIHVVDTYRIYCGNGNTTGCDNSEALWENAAVRMLRPQEDLDEKPFVYTTWKHAHNGDDCVAGTYFTLQDLIDTNNNIQLNMELIVPVDDFLPLSAFQLYPNAIFGELIMEIKHTINKNMVYCQVDPIKEIERMSVNFHANTKGTALFYNSLKTTIPIYSKRFTQIPDPSFAVIPLINQVGGVILKQVTPTFSCLEGELKEAKSVINGFNIRKSVLDRLKNKYELHKMIVPAQFVKHNMFSQSNPQNGLTHNINLTLVNVSSLIVFFPRTGNEITCSENPHLSNLQLFVNGKAFPDKNVGSLDATHAMYCLQNAGLDELFSPNKELSYSYTFDESVEPIKFDSDEELTNTSKQQRKVVHVNRMPEKDNTSYCFVVSTERLAGYGSFVDGLTLKNTEIDLKGSLKGSVDRNPYLYNPVTGIMHQAGPSLLVVQDCFWELTVDKGAVFVKNDVFYYHENTKDNSLREDYRSAGVDYQHAMFAGNIRDQARERQSGYYRERREREQKHRQQTRERMDRNRKNNKPLDYSYDIDFDSF